jgi:carbon monoxide dehydrogenase subunit G
MRVEGTHVFDAPRDIVWPMLLDPKVLAKALPGCERLEQVGDNQYEGAMKIKIGPVQGTFDGQITLSDITEPESASISVSGEGIPGFVTGTGRLTLEEAGEQAALAYEGDAQIGGRLAAVGQRLLDSSTRAIIGAGLEALDAHIEATRKPVSGGSAAPADTALLLEPPSQSKFAFGVVRHMVRDALGGDENPELVKARLRAAKLIVLAYCLGWWRARHRR